MGQVFTWNAVQRGHVPQLDDFNSVISTLRKELATEDSIVGALVFGSVVRGDHSRRSDLDCFVLYDHMQEQRAFAYMQQATADATTQAVPLGFVPCDTLLAKTRLHHIGSSFLRHLKRSAQAGGLIKGNPLIAIAPNVPERMELESYMRMKMYNLQEAWSAVRTFSEERTVSYLRKLLEAPLHVARKVLAHQDLLHEDSKAFIRAQYSRFMDTELTDQLEHLVSLDSLYSETLLQQLNRPNKEQYEQMLQRLLFSTETVFSFLRGNLAYIANTVH